MEKKMLKHTLLIMASAAMASASISALAEGDAAAGKADFTKNGCVACHGAEGQSVNPAMFPVLKGKDADYISKQLHAFKSGERKGQGPGMIMNQNTKKLSDNDIANIAAFIESLK
ncbi:cytochrome C class I [Candidatus Nitrosoglobus terrae]|uniref:Cytochrome C class I n=1 Tax=Candidatus Nitrosoglobus terrae TaxID=1630141 RepID=A0A1Q2SK77_9GAMM|nr:cytochrome c [Candidatus Nitrosoglobus terrae]BAW79524.1 cytochrome C class I [Candidatus Nitrosoglobus terrae]